MLRYILWRIAAMVPTFFGAYWNNATEVAPLRRAT